jgi:hypothetical protein
MIIYADEWVHRLPQSYKNALLRGESIVVGDKVMLLCRNCNTVIQVNKTFFGSLHICE